MGAMSLGVLIPVFKEGPRSKKVIKQFSSSIDKFLTLHDNGDEVIPSKLNLGSNQIGRNDALLIELRLEEDKATKEARIGVEEDIMAMERSHGVWTRLPQEDERPK